MIKHVIRVVIKRPRVYALGLGLLFSAHPLGAQELEWEQVGDIPINAQDVAFDEENNLWAIGSRLWKLPELGSVWEEIADGPGFLGDEVYPLSADSVLRGGGFISRSIDGGESWDVVWDEGGVFYETDLGGPNAGMLLTGVTCGCVDSIGIGYSLDRGATWQGADFTLGGGWNREADAFLELPEGGGPWPAGRLVAAGVGGLSYSDDGGRLWQPSNIWADLAAGGVSLALGYDGVVYASAGDGVTPGGVHLWRSDDGTVWTYVSTLPDSFFLNALPDPAPTGSLVAVTEFELEASGVYGSTNGGETWILLGRVPLDPTNSFVQDAIIGPDDLLYVGVSRTGPEDAWVYRTTEQVVVANEPEAPPPTAERLIVYPNPATDEITVEAGGIDRDVVLYDLLGRAVLRVRLVAGKAELDTGRLPAGVYVVRVGGESRLVAVVR